MIPGDQGVGQKGPRGSSCRPRGSHGVKVGKKIPWGQGVGLEGPRGSSGRPKGSQGVKGGQGVGLQGPSGSRGRQVFRLTFKSKWVGETD